MDSPTINTKGADKIKYVDIAISLVISMISYVRVCLVMIILWCNIRLGVHTL